MLDPIIEGIRYAERIQWQSAESSDAFILRAGIKALSESNEWQEKVLWQKRFFARKGVLKRKRNSE